MSNLPKYFYFKVKATRKGTAIEVEDASDCDVVEVVRCKDCKFGDWYYSGQRVCYCTNHGCGGFAEEDFCSKGESE